ncbi:AbfB domain-containing protein [Streptomyces zingiberis]|uniref:Alpha-L-arabinofuranosidase B arabinose-binding domain-containing protein n=1 Tax=Streptomyces zingiberis TaxID=2053010 RepID=A0ABX1BTY6_9ACTN|nr:AbfB domain-containing protein [Streptomyces zingiberis]NJP99687.1 hypothetical protein [Streptomyces zingiberis]
MAKDHRFDSDPGPDPTGFPPYPGAGDARPGGPFPTGEDTGFPPQAGDYPYTSGPFASAGARSDPYAGARAATDPFAGQAPADPFAGARAPADPFAGAETPADPFAGAQAPADPFAGAQAPADPFAGAQASSADPFASAPSRTDAFPADPFPSDPFPPDPFPAADPFSSMPAASGPFSTGPLVPMAPPAPAPEGRRRKPPRERRPGRSARRGGQASPPSPAEAFFAQAPEEPAEPSSPPPPPEDTGGTGSRLRRWPLNPVLFLATLLGLSLLATIWFFGMNDGSLLPDGDDGAAPRPTPSLPNAPQPSVPPSPTAPEGGGLPEPGAVAKRSFQAVNYPGRYLRHSDGRIRLSRIDAGDVPDDRRAAFNVLPGLSDDSCYSFKNDEGRYVRVDADSQVVLSALGDSQSFRRQATFCDRPGATADSVSFESQFLPDVFLRHRNFALKAETTDGSKLFRNDSSFRLVAPLG